MPSKLEVVKMFHPTVKRVVDARHPLIIEISKRDANTGKVKDHSHCIVAEACKKKLHLEGAVVTIRRAYLLDKDGTATRYEVPESVRRELVSFDRGAGFAPGSYELVPIPKSQRGTHSRGRKKQRGRPLDRPGNRNTKGKHFTKDIRASMTGSSVRAA